MRKKTTKPAERKSKKQAAKPVNFDQQKPHDIASVTDAFLHEIRSLQHADRETMKALIQNLTGHAEHLNKFLEQFQPAKDEKASITIPASKIEALTRITRDLSAAATSVESSRRGLFLVLVSKWDAFFASLLRWVYKIKPEIIDSSQRTISFSDLKKLNSIGAAQEKIIEDEVSTVLRDSHGDQFAYLERRIGTPLTKIEIWPTFIEITQRRNLIAHTDGRVSDQYLQVCAAHKVMLPNDISEKTRLGANPQYFQNACDCVTEMGFKLSQVLWRKLHSQDSQNAELHLMNTTFEMLKAEQYALAIRILEFSMTPPMKFEDARTRLVCIVNLSLAYKWSGNEEKCISIVGREDWSASSLDFLCAAAVLKNDFSSAVSLMKKIGAHGDITREAYREWPLFKEFRKKPSFAKAYKEIFGSDMEVESLLSDVTNTLSHSSRSLPESKA